jgi:hypothetical protein
VGSRSFVESFVHEAFYEDLGMISNLPMLADHKVTFVMFLLCYAQCLDYCVSICMSMYLATLR